VRYYLDVKRYYEKSLDIVGRTWILAA